MTLSTPETSTDDWQDTVWTAGDYERVARQYLPMAAHLVDRLEIDAGESVLDVGCGTGSAAITAARLGSSVTGVDLTPEFIDRARENERITGCKPVEWHQGDAAALPLGDDQFDVVLSNLGHMYGDPPDVTASELARVARTGGRIGYTAWTPTGLYPAMASAVLPYLDPEDVPPYSSPPFMWGDESTARNRLDEHATDIAVESGSVSVPALSPAHFWEDTRATSGVFHSLVETVPPDRRPDLRDDLREQIRAAFDERHNVVALEYLLVTATVTAAD